jgi:hypothetical protein
MITLEDCVAFSGLTHEEILAIADHEHVPETVACALGEYLSATSGGETQIRDMIVDDIRVAQGRGDRAEVQRLLHVLHHYLTAHPQAAPLAHPWSSRA